MLLEVVHSDMTVKYFYRIQLYSNGKDLPGITGLYTESLFEDFVQPLGFKNQ